MKVDISREDGELSVSISKNGEEITDIPGATVEIPKSSGSGTRTVLTDEEGNSYTGMVNETQNVAVIPVDKTGEYSIKEEQSQDASENGEEIEKALDEETDTEEETADDSYETAEIAGEDVEAAQKTTGDSSQDDLRKQHIKTTALVAGIVVLLILLLLLPMRKNRRLRKGDRGEGEEDR